MKPVDSSDINLFKNSLNLFEIFQLLTLTNYNNDVYIFQNGAHILESIFMAYVMNGIEFKCERKSQKHIILDFVVNLRGYLLNNP